jgi:tRNA (guanine-N7-)-methyltransferase
MSRRIRKHANPFNCRVDLALLDRRALFGREARLEVEIGSGAGGFLSERARHHPELDFVGLEVRAPMVEAAMARRTKEGPPNVLFFHANANLNLGLAPPGAIQRFHVHFPDPWFKKRHFKRRVVQPETVRTMALLLPLGGEIYAQSDVPALALEMFRFFDADGALLAVLDAGMLVPPPFPEQTEWERQHEREGEPVYRMLFRKVREPTGPIPTLESRPIV